MAPGQKDRIHNRLPELELELEVCVTPSDVAVVGELRQIAAALTRNNLPRSFHVNIENGVHNCHIFNP